MEAVATNLRWTWHWPTRAVLDTLPGADPHRHPAATVVELEHDDPTALADWFARHGDEVTRLAAEVAELRASCTPEAARTPAVAYFSPEFGIAAQVAQYSGGLGILAGDHLKASSDLDIPLVGVGLLYREGFFRQDVVDNRQRERHERIEPADIGAVDTGAVAEVTIGGRRVEIGIWEQWVGRTRLVLLDTDRPVNSEVDRRITDRLYSGDRRHRLDQELVLGVGGVRALRAVDVVPGLYHLNEGHACFLLLELLGELVDDGTPLEEAIDVVRQRTLFTTHTPVPAGIDRFDRDLIAPELEPWAERLGLNDAPPNPGPPSTPGHTDPTSGVDRIFDWATLPSDTVLADPPPFNTAALAIELCGQINGVSQLHAEVSRELFATLPRTATLTGITNGVHSRTWVSPALQAFYDDNLGVGWAQGDPAAWARAADLDVGDLESIRRSGRGALVDLVAAGTGVELDPDGIVIGFARRFATYKRAALLLRDREGLERALAAGAQFVFAGKAHPADEEGKAVLAELAEFAASNDSQGQVALVPDYDIAIAQAMYAGSDVWLNNPVRPHEACGTSGEKAALNGGLNCSILDGWWADFWTPGTGWVIPTHPADEAVDQVGDVADAVRDDAEARALHQVVNDEVLPLFAGPGWWDEVRTMLTILGPLVTAGRMVNEYDTRFYRPERVKE